MGRLTPCALLLLTAFRLHLLLAAAPQISQRCTCREVITNFDCRINGKEVLSKPWSRCQRTLQEGPAQPLPALVLSTVQCCQHKQETCLRVLLALNSTGINGLELDFFVPSLNRYGELWVLKKRKRQIIEEPVWQMQFDGFQVENGWEVLVSMKAIPPARLSLSQSYVVSDNQPGPEFQYKWVPAARAIEVSVPKGPNTTVRLCHELALECKQLRQPFHQQELVSTHHPALLLYELLLPCLCIEAFYDQEDSLRKMVCPFQDQPEAYGPDLWSSMQFYDYSSSDKNEMAMSMSGRCLLNPTPMASLCWKESADPGALCQDIPNSTATEADKASMPLQYVDIERLTIPITAYILEEVDMNPQLCFKFSYNTTSHIECPHKTDTTWNVSLSAKFLQLHLTFHSRISASFSSALCQQLPSGQCKPEPPVYTVTHPEGSALGELDLILPWRALRSCVLVWRSDVRFAGKRLLCPDVSHRRWGLLAFGVGLGLGFLAVVILLIHWNTQGLHRGASSWHHSRPILLIYSPDSEEHKQLVCAFAALLRSALGCPVLLDLWELGHVGRLGILPWLYAQREHVGRKQGRVLLLWSAGSAQAYGLWRGEAGREGRPAPEPHDLFGAAMACLHGELQGTSGTVQQSDWAIAYFSKLCGRRDIPCALRFLPRYRLPQELPDLVRALQGSSGSAPGWLHASAKALVGRLLKAEKKSPRHRLNPPWRKSTKRLAGSQVPLAHPKLHRPSCT